MSFCHIIFYALGAIATIGIITSTITSMLVVAGIFRFRGIRHTDKSNPFQPPVSVLKPVHGDEPDLEENLTTFYTQNYPEYEVLFCARHDSDAGLAIARKVAARFPHIKTRILTCGEPPWPNARTYSLEVMLREALHPILVTSDSDVRVDPDYLTSVVAPMRDENVGLVTCLYRGVTRLGIWAELEAIGMSVEMTSGVLVASMLEGMKFALGPTMVMRKSSVEKIGGCKEVAQYYADDFVFGNWIANSGEKVILSDYIIEHHVLNGTFKKSIAHQQGWATSTRYSRPMGHLGEVLTYAVPYGLLALIASLCAHQWAAGLCILAYTILNRVMLSLLVGSLVVKDKNAICKPWLYPTRDLMGFLFWVRSYFGSRRLRYRGDPYEILPKGRLRKL